MADPREVAARWMEAFNAHDRDGMRAVTAPDVTMTAPPEVALEGEPAVTGYAMAWLDAFPDATVTVHHETAGGDTVVQEFTFQGTHGATLSGPQGDIPATNRRLNGRGAQALEVRDGMISEVRLYFDEVQLLTQLGLMTAQAPG